VKAGLSVAAVVLGVGLAPLPAGADGPGYGGNADALTVLWEINSQRRGLAVYAVGFRGGSAVRVRVGSEAERTVTADPYGAVDLLFTSAAAATSASAGTAGTSASARASATAATSAVPTTSATAATSAIAGTSEVAGSSAVALATGASVLVTGHTPAGELRTLIGAVPPEMTGRGAAEIVPWVAALAGSLLAGLWLRRRYGSVFAGNVRRYRHPARHRA
jgi:hypothetical protein